MFVYAREREEERERKRERETETEREREREREGKDRILLHKAVNVFIINDATKTCSEKC